MKHSVNPAMKDHARVYRTIQYCARTLVLAVMFTSCAESVQHDENSAAKRAIEFARVLFIEKNLDKGYQLLSENGRRHVPLDKFKQTITAMHPRAYPSRISALEYEPMAGEKAIYIYLSGQNSEEQIGYRVTLEGTAATGYQVLKIDRGASFPTLSNQKRSFKTVLSVP
jgi:hypothetical protein